MSRPVLFGGRGSSLPPEQQAEAYELRRQVKPAPKVLLWHSLEYGVETGSLITANTFRMLPMPVFNMQDAIVAASVRCTTSNPSAKLNTALYRLDGTRGFVQVPGSKATFPGDNTGVVSWNFQRRLQLNPGEMYFVGVASNDSTARWSGAASSISIPNWGIDYSDPPTRIAVNTKTLVNLINVTYYTFEGREVFLA